MATAQTSIIVAAKDNATPVFEKIGASANKLVSTLSTLSTASSAALSVKEAGEYESQLFNLRKVTSQSLETIRKDIESLPSGLGSYSELTAGYYQVMSSGITDSALALDTLTTASKLSAVAGVTQSEAIKALAQMMAGYKGQIEDVARASDTLLDIEQYGTTSVRELIPVIGELSSASQAAGLSVNEMGAAMAVLTQTSGGTDKAATQLRALEMSLMNANGDMQKVFDALGAKNWNELAAKNGFAGGLSLIEQAAQKSGIEMVKLLGSSEAFMGYLGVSRGNFSGFNEQLANMGTQAGRTQTLFDAFNQTYTGALDEAKNSLSNLGTLFGTGLLPVVAETMTQFSGYIDQNSAKLKALGSSAGESLSAIKSSLENMIGVWEQLPDWMTGPAGIGLVGGILFGPKGGLMLAALEGTGLIGSLRGLMAASNGQISWDDYKNSNKEELAELLNVSGFSGDATAKFAELDSRKRALERRLSEIEETLQTPSGEADITGFTSASSPELELEKEKVDVQAQLRRVRTLEQMLVARKASQPPFVGETAILTSGESPDKTPAPLPGLPAGFTPPSFKSGGNRKSASEKAMRSAQEGLQRIREEIAKLNGESETNTLRKKWDEIAKLGEKAKASGDDIANLQNEYASAFQSDTLRDFDREMVRLGNDAGALRQLEISDTIKEWENRFRDAGMSADEAAPRIMLLKEKLDEQSDIRNLETAADFYRELSRLTGDYSTSTEYQNRLLETQADIYLQSLGPGHEKYVQQWKELMQLQNSRDGWDGIQRASIGYVSTATDAASQMEDVFTTAFRGIGNIGGAALEEIFEKGSFAVDKYFANISRQIAILAANAATNQLIGGIFGFLANGLSFGGTATANAVSETTAVQGIMGNIAPVRLFHDGGRVGTSGASRAVPFSLFSDAPRYHAGGFLRPDERPAILQTGEQVLSRGDTAGLGVKLDRIAALLTTQASQSTGGTNVVLVDDQRKVKNYLMSPEGQKTFVAMLNSNRASVQNVAQGGRA